MRSNNQFKLLVKFDNTPLELDRQLIKERISKFLLDIDPTLDLEIKTGEGSWWVMVVTWVGNQLAGWLVNKSFDKIADSLTQEETMTKANSVDSLSSELVNSSENPENSTKDSITARAALLDEMEKLRQKLTDQDNNKKIKIVFGVFNNEKRKGRIASLSDEDDEITFSLIETDSQEDFNSRTHP